MEMEVCIGLHLFNIEKQKAKCGGSAKESMGRKKMMVDSNLKYAALSTIYIDYKMSDPVVNWDAIVHKNVRSKDGQDAGNVDAIDADTVVIITEGARKEYNLPKSQVEGFNGAEVSLKVTFGELEKYRV